MRISTLSILACCAALGGAIFPSTPASAQSNRPAAPASTPAEQTQALQALRNAEAGPIVPDVFAQNTSTQPREGIVAPEPTATGLTAPGQTPALAPGPIDTKEAVIARQKEAILAEAQRQRKLAEEKAITDRVAMSEQARRQREQDEARVKEATDKAQADLAAMDAAAKQQQAEDDQRIQQATEAERAAAEQVRIARADEAAAAERARIARERVEAEERARVAKAKEEAERLKKQMGSTASNAPGFEPEIVTPTAKDRKLAELLRRYEADEITPYEYHLQRAKIMAEP